MPTPRRLRRPLAIVTLTLTSSLVGGVACSSGGDGTEATTTTTRPAGDALTEADVERLAQVLFANLQAGGAQVQLSVDHTADRTVTAEGEVDWARHQGALQVTSTGADGRAVTEEVRFTEEAVYDPIPPDQAAALAAAGRPGVAWVERAPDPDARPVDQLIELLVSLAATRPDNPQLVAQRQLAYDGREEVAGRPADAYTAGETGATYWLDDTDRLVRFRGTLPGFVGPVVVELADHAPVTVDLPPPTEVIAEADLPG